MFKKLYESSLLMSFLSHWSAWLTGFISKIGFNKIFLLSDFFEKKKSESFFASLFKKLGISKGASVIKRRFSILTENSLIIKSYRKAIDKILSATVRSFAVFLLSFGMYSAAAYAIKIYTMNDKNISYNEIIMVIIIILAAVPLLFSKRSIAQKITEGYITCGIAETLTLGIIPLTNRTKTERHEPSAFVLGTAAGLFSFVFPSTKIFFILAAIAFVCVVLYSPEGGLVSSLFLIPVTNEKTVYFLLAVSLFSYLLKYLRGKRNLSFKTADLVVLSFYLFYMIAGGSQNIVKFVFAYVLYFLITNTIKNHKLFHNCLAAAGMGIAINGIITAIGSLLDIYRPGLTGLTELFNKPTFISGEVFASIGASIILMMFFTAESRIIKLFYFISFSAVLYNIISSFSANVWILTVFALLIFLIIKHGRILNVLFLTGLTAPFVYYGLKYISIYNSVSPIVFLPFAVKKISLLGGMENSAVHNFYGMLIQNGGIVFTLIFAFAIFLLICSRHRANEKQRSEAAFMLAMVIFFCVSGFFINPLKESICGLYFSFFTGMLSVCCGRENKNAETEYAI